MPGRPAWPSCIQRCRRVFRRSHSPGVVALRAPCVTARSLRARPRPSSRQRLHALRAMLHTPCVAAQPAAEHGRPRIAGRGRVLRCGGRVLLACRGSSPPAGAAPPPGGRPGARPATLPAAGGDDLVQDLVQDFVQDLGQDLGDLGPCRADARRDCVRRLALHARRRCHWRLGRPPAAGRGSGDRHTPPFAVTFGAMAAGAAPSLAAYPYAARLRATVAPGGVIAADAVTPAAGVVDVTATRHAAVRREVVAVSSARRDDVRRAGVRRRAKTRGGPRRCTAPRDRRAGRRDLGEQDGAEDPAPASPRAAPRPPLVPPATHPARGSSPAASRPPLLARRSSPAARPARRSSRPHLVPPAARPACGSSPAAPRPPLLPTRHRLAPPRPVRLLVRRSSSAAPRPPLLARRSSPAAHPARGSSPMAPRPPLLARRSSLAAPRPPLPAAHLARGSSPVAPRPWLLARRSSLAAARRSSRPWLLARGSSRLPARVSSPAARPARGSSRPRLLAGRWGGGGEATRAWCSSAKAGMASK